MWVGERKLIDKRERGKLERDKDFREEEKGER